MQITALPLGTPLMQAIWFGQQRSPIQAKPSLHQTRPSRSCFLSTETYDDIFAFAQYIIEDSIFSVVDPLYSIDDANTIIVLSDTQVFAISVAFTDFLFEKSEGESHG